MVRSSYEGTQYFPGDPTAWQRYEAVLTLPAGSVPGLWGVNYMTLTDKAGYYRQHTFVELMHFNVSGN